MKFFLRALILSVVIIAGSTVCNELSATQDSLWQEIEASLQQDDRQESIRLLRLSVFAANNIEESEPLLYSMLSQRVEDFVASGSVNELDSSSLEKVYNLQFELAQLGVATQSDWKMLLDISLAFPQSDRFILAGQQFLDHYITDDDLIFDQDWIELLTALEENLTRNEQALYRLRLCQMLVSADSTNDDYNARLAEAKIVAEAQAVSILELARVAIFMGDLDSASGYIEQVRRYDSSYLGLEEISQKFHQAKRLEKLLMAATDAFSRRKYKEAGKICREILEQDSTNLGASRILQQITDARGRSVKRVVSDQDRLTLRLRKLHAELREAEKTHDLMAIRQVLKELLLLKNDSELITRLEEVEHQISMSRIHARQRFSEAVGLFKAQRYEELLRFLNRNPGLTSSVDKLVEVWEMRLMANYYSGQLEKQELERSALNILEKGGASFYANYVLMRLALADNKMTAARKYYNDAAAINDNNQMLRLPGLILWVHGDGRVFAVILLMIFLFAAAKAIGPTIRLYEKTWWFRIRFISYLFPSLAIRSIESSFSNFKSEKEQIKLFTLLKNCAMKTGDKKRVAIYTQNLMRLLKPDEQDLKEVNAARESDSELLTEENFDSVDSAADTPAQNPPATISAREIMAQNRSQDKDDSLSESLDHQDNDQQFEPEANKNEKDSSEPGIAKDVSTIELALQKARQQLFSELDSIEPAETAKTVEYTEADVRNCASKLFADLD